MGNDLRALALALVVATVFLGTFAGASSADVNPKPPDASFYDWDWRIIIRVKGTRRGLEPHRALGWQLPQVHSGSMCLERFDQRLHV